MKFNKFITFAISTLIINSNIQAMQDNNFKYLFYPDINDDIKENNNKNIDNEINLNNEINTKEKINELNKNLKGDTEEAYINEFNSVLLDSIRPVPAFVKLMVLNHTLPALIEEISYKLDELIVIQETIGHSLDMIYIKLAQNLRALRQINDLLTNDKSNTNNELEIDELNKNLKGNAKEEKYNIYNQIFSKIPKYPVHVFMEEINQLRPALLCEIISIDIQKSKVKQVLNMIDNNLKQISDLMKHNEDNTNLQITIANRTSIIPEKKIENENPWILIEGKKKRQRKPK